MLFNNPRKLSDLEWDEVMNDHSESSWVRPPLQKKASNVNPIKVEMIKRVFWSKPTPKVYSDVSDYFISIQDRYSPPWDLMNRSKQPMINHKMRALLIEWMMEVASEFGLKRETYYLALNYLDRYAGKVNNIEK